MRSTSCLAFIAWLYIIRPSVSMLRRNELDSSDGAQATHDPITPTTAEIGAEMQGSDDEVDGNVGEDGGEEENDDDDASPESVTERVRRLAQEGSKIKKSAADRYATITKRKWMKV